MIQIDGLTRTFNSIVAVHDLSFRVENGEVLGLIGPNGAGKTTTLRCIAGIIPPSRGNILIDGYSITKDPIAAKRRIGFVPEEPLLFEHLTVIEHLEFTAGIYGVEAFETKARALLKELGLPDQGDLLPNELSRGMKQKLAIACALLHLPENLILDEPLAGLDPVGMHHIKKTILDCARAGTAVIVSSHLLHVVEQICHRILILKNGRKVFHGSIEEIYQNLAVMEGDLDLEEIFLRVTGNSDRDGR